MRDVTPEEARAYRFNVWRNGNNSWTAEVFWPADYEAFAFDGTRKSVNAYKYGASYRLRPTKITRRDRAKAVRELQRHVTEFMVEVTTKALAEADYAQATEV